MRCFSLVIKTLLTYDCLISVKDYIMRTCSPIPRPRPAGNCADNLFLEQSRTCFCYDDKCNVKGITGTLSGSAVRCTVPLLLASAALVFVLADC